MKKWIVLGGVLWGTAAVWGGISRFDFSPNPSDLYDLEHEKAYQWGILWAVPAGQELVSATLFFDQIDNWKEEENILYLDLLNLGSRDKLGLKIYRDYEDPSDFFEGKSGAVRIGTYIDSRVPFPEDISFSFGVDQLSALKAYAADGFFGIGFDPDCRYFNKGVRLSLFTDDGITPKQPVPESGSLACFALGLAALACVRRKVD